MKNTGSIFTSIFETLCRRNTAITTALEQYRRQVDTAKNTYKDAIAAEKIDALTAETRQVIGFADQKAADEAEAQIAELHKLLKAYIIAPPDMALIDRMRAVKSFGRTLSRLELEGFAEAANGNYCVLSCVERLASENGYILTFPDVGVFENDLAEIRQLFSVPSFWAPPSLVHEALTCSPNVVFHGIDYGRPTAARVVLAQSVSSGAEGSLKSMAERWSENVHYKLTEAGETTADTNAQSKVPTVEQIPEDTAEIVRERAAEQAAAEKAATATMERFKL